MTGKPRALLALEDGTVFSGYSCGAAGESAGELCFNTCMIGYQEVITDPSYAGQLLAMTYPQIGNYGVNPEDMQSESPALRGVIVRDMCFKPSNFRSTDSLPDMLKGFGVVAIEGIDTRKLTRHIRELGAMRGVLSTEDLDPESLVAKAKASPSIVGVDLVDTVTCDEPYSVSAEADKRRFKVVAYDCGVKRSILLGLASVGCDVTVVPAQTKASEVLDMKPDGVFFSNGPGDPTAVPGITEEIEKLIGVVPIFGICLGHQLIARAADVEIEKLKYGHHGGNQPVKNLVTGRVEITSQNHGFGIRFGSLGHLIPAESLSTSGQKVSDTLDDLKVWADADTAPVVENEKYGRIRLTHVNLNDGTAEGIEFLDQPVFSVQYHPEASPGPSDSSYLFDAFADMMLEAK